MDDFRNDFWLPALDTFIEYEAIKAKRPVVQAARQPVKTSSPLSGVSTQMLIGGAGFVLVVLMMLANK